MRIDLTLRSADGDERDVAVLAPPGTRVADVAPLLAAVQPGPLERAGAPLAPGTALGPGGVQSGEILTVRGRSVRGPRFATAHRLDVVGGPDSGTGIALGRAPVTIGRSTACDLVLRDPAVSRVHAEVALTPRGPTVRDRGSKNGTTVDGAPVGPDGSSVRTGRLVRVGDTFLGLAATTSPATLTRSRPDGTVLVNRPPRSGTPPAVDEIVLPEPPAAVRPQRIGWFAAVVPAAAGVGLAIGLHAPQFLLFSVLSPIALVATGLGERLHWRRDRQRRGARYRNDLAAARQRIGRAVTGETRSRRARDPDPAAVLRTAQLPGARLWDRRRGEPDLLRVRLGLGDVPSLTRVRDGTTLAAAATVVAVPASVDLGDGPLGVCGPRDVVLAVARWVVGQIAVHASPSDVELALLLSAEAEPAWRWARWLPHVAGRVATEPDEHRALLTDLGGLRERRSAGGGAGPDGRWPGSWVLLIVDRCSALAEVVGLGELLDGGARTGIAVLCLDARRIGLPSSCTNVAAVTGETGSRLRLRGPAVDLGVVADQVSHRWAGRVARVLAPLRDAGAGPVDSVPDYCELLALLGLTEPTPGTVRASWAHCPPGLTTVLGVAADGPVSIDLVRDGPHALVAGTTGAGKSELLRALVAGLAARYPPDAVTFVLVDYKGGAAFADCARLPHTVGLVTDLDPHLAERALLSLERELTRREELFARAGARDVDEYRAAEPDGSAPRLVIVIDEFAELAAELGDFVSGLIAIARRGRSLGVHLVLATQRPSGVVSPEIRANTALRIALRVTDPAESRDVIDADTAATISRRRPGRACLRLPAAPLIVLQTAHVGASRSTRTTTPHVIELDNWRRLPLGVDATVMAVTDLELLVRASGAAAAASGRPPPRRPWLPALPDQIAVAELAAARRDGPDERVGRDRIPLGLCDVPRSQQQTALVVDLGAGGSVLLAGGPRSGRTSAVLTLAVTAAAELAPDALHLYAIDWAGGGLAPLARLPHCGSAIGADIECTATILERLDAEVAERRRLLAREPDAILPLVLCVLDGWDSFVAAADEHDAGRTVETLCGLLRTAASVGLTVVITGDRATLAVRLSSIVATRLILRLTDRADYALAGLAERNVPGALPPGRAVRAEDGVEIQLAHLGRDPSPAQRDAALARAVRRWDGTRPGPRALIRVRPLPDRFRLADAPRAGVVNAVPGAGVILGVGGDTAEPVIVDLFAGTARLLVAGPPRSGRSTVLCGLLPQLTAAGCAVVAAAPRRSPLATLALRTGVRLLTPDEPVVEVCPDDGRAVLLIDDCEAFLDTPAGDRLTDWIRGDSTGLAVAAAGASDELAVTFRGIAAEVRRARCTVLLHPGPGDADLAGVPLPRRRSGQSPGRGLLIGDPAWGDRFARPLPIQIALP